MQCSIAKYGIKWIYNKKIVETNSDEASSATATPALAIKRRKREIMYLWYINYTCHRFGTKQENNFVNLSGQQRELQKKTSKRSSCPACLKVTFFKRNPNVVVLETIKQHYHKVGGTEDMRYLPLSKEARAYTKERLHEGYGKRDTRVSIKKNYRKYIQDLNNSFYQDINTVMHRDQLIHADEVCNIYKKIEETFYKRANNPKDSIKIWMDELFTKGYNYNTDFTFGFSSLWQQRLLLRAELICLDATHCVTNTDKGILYTIVIRHPLTGTGCPVAFMFTEDHSMTPIKKFLIYVRLSAGLQSFRKITIDVSSTEYRAIQAAYPQSTVQ